MPTKKQKTPSEVTTASAWKAKSGAKPLELPSGHVCLARRASMQTFLKTGKIPNSLMAPLQQAMAKADGKAPDKLDLKELVKDPAALIDLFEMVDEVTLYCVIEPKLSAVVAESDKDPDTLYVDEVDLDDKMFIFQWAVGGSSDLEQFRSELATGVDALSAS